MNDLNSIFVVGRLTEDAELKGDTLIFTIKNEYSTYDEQTKSYKKEDGIFVCSIKGKEAKRLMASPAMKKGVRIGVNGRLSPDLLIIAISIQVLDKTT